ncbi:hypothetical protein Lal_00027808 [Lupinus albus]|nr:hypothetical protein Lal_00027808 [Lupinus albus]
MLLRGKATEDQLQFNPEIERSAKSNRKKSKAKKKQDAQSDSLQSGSQQAPISDTPFKMDDNSTNSNDERTNPPRRTLGDYAMWESWKNRWQSNIPIVDSFRQTQTNPKEHFKAITTRSGKVISPDFGKKMAVEEEVLNGQNPSLKRGHQVKKSGILAQARISRSSEMCLSLLIDSRPVADKNHPPEKNKSGTSGHAAPSFNRHKFTSLEREERYNTLLQSAFWGAIASPNEKFDPDVVRELYANAYPPEEGGGLFEQKSWVRGKVIRYDRDYLNMMLNNPYEVRDGHLDGYHNMVEKSGTNAHRFAINETMQQLCIPGRTVSANVFGHPKRIYQKDMTTLAQIWMIFYLHNVIPNSHVSFLPLPYCHQLYCIMAGVEIDVARLMTIEIYKTAVKLEKKGTMGFPYLTTSLCARQGVTVNPTEPIKKPITKQYIKQNCMEETTESQGQKLHSSSSYRNSKCKNNTI